MTEESNQTLQEISTSIDQKKDVLSPIAIEAKKEFDQEELMRFQEDKEWIKENRKVIKELSRRIDFLNNILQKYDLSLYNQFSRSPKRAILANLTLGFFRGLGIALGIGLALFIYFWLILNTSSLTKVASEISKLANIFKFHF